MNFSNYVYQVGQLFDCNDDLLPDVVNCLRKVPFAALIDKRQQVLTTFNFSSFSHTSKKKSRRKCGVNCTQDWQTVVLLLISGYFLKADCRPKATEGELINILPDCSTQDVSCFAELRTWFLDHDVRDVENLTFCLVE